MPFGKKEKAEVREFMEKHGTKFPELKHDDLGKSPMELIRFADSLCSLKNVENFVLANKSTAVFTLRNTEFDYLAVGWNKKCTFRAFTSLKIPLEVNAKELINEMAKENVFDDRLVKDDDLVGYLKNCGARCEGQLAMLKGDKYLPPGNWSIIRWSEVSPDAGNLSSSEGVETFLSYLTKCVGFAGEAFDTAVNKLSRGQVSASPPIKEPVRKCGKCGFEFTPEAAFCPKCGIPVDKKMSDEEISALIFRRFGKKTDEALEEASKAFKIDLEGGSLHKDLLIRYMVPDMMPREAEYQDEAIERFIKKHEGDPRLEEVVAHYKLGLICENSKKLKEAVKEYEKTLASFADFAPALARRGSVRLATGKFKDALKDFIKAGEVDPEFCLAFFQQGILYKKRKKRDKALESYEKCVALDPDNAAAHNNMGLIYVDKQNFENAENEFKEVLRIFPNHPTGLKNLELARRRRGRGLRRLF